MRITPSSFSFIRSTCIVVFVSSLVGWGCQLAGSKFLPGFLLATALQFILFSAIASTLKSYFAHQTRQKELDALEPLSTILECAACKAPNMTTFIPDQNERIEFACNKCQRKNVVSISFTVAAVSESNNDLIPSPNFSTAPVNFQK